MRDCIYLALPFPPSENHANDVARSKTTGKVVVFQNRAKLAFLRAADAMFLQQKRSLLGKCIDGPFSYHLLLDENLRHGNFDGQNRQKYALDYLQRVGLIANDKFAMGGSWAWGPCEHPALIGVWPFDASKNHRVPETPAERTDERTSNRP